MFEKRCSEVHLTIRGRKGKGHKNISRIFYAERERGIRIFHAERERGIRIFHAYFTQKGKGA